MRSTQFSQVWLLLALVVGRCVAQNRQPTQNLFNVDFSTNILGGCYYVGLNRMDRVLDDSLELAEAGLRATSDYLSEPEAIRIVNAFFKLQALGALDQIARVRQIQGEFRNVRDWLRDGGIVPIPPAQPGSQGPNGRPRLYCHHSWVQRRSFNEVALDVHGNSHNFPDGSEIRIRDVWQYQQDRQQAANDLGIDVNRVYPYRSYIHNAYFFDQSYAPGPGTGYCSDTTQAVTYHRPDSWITLCPRSFHTTNARPSNWEYRGIYAFEPHPVPAAQVGNQDQHIGQIDPTAATMFHELFHLVLGGRRTTPGNPWDAQNDEIYDVDQLLHQDMTFDLALLNPESFTQLAVAYARTRHFAPVNGRRLEWYTGFTTRG